MTRIVFLLSCLAALAVYTNGDNNDEVKRSSMESEGPWRKISDHPVCFEGKGNKHGTLKYHGQCGMVGALKPFHRSGFIQCGTSAVHKSRWGCSNLSWLVQYPLNVIITDISNHIIYPAKQFFKPGHAGSHGLWYYLPATDTLHDRELVFTNYETPFYLRHHATLRVWFGEDLRAWFEGDNSGHVCVDVYAHVL